MPFEAHSRRCTPRTGLGCNRRPMEIQPGRRPLVVLHSPSGPSARPEGRRQDLCTSINLKPASSQIIRRRPMPPSCCSYGRVLLATTRAVPPGART